MNTDIRLKVSFPNHHKTKKLLRKLGPQGPLSLICLWLYVAENKPTGILNGMDEDDIAVAAQWNGDAAEMVDALLSAGFVEKSPAGDFVIHDWTENNPWAANAPARSEKALKAAKSRWDKRNGVGEENVSDATSNATSIKSDATSNAKTPKTDARSNAPSPTPNPSPNPSPSPKEENLKSLSAVADVALEIILKDETLFPITESDVTDWIKLFPSVDVVEVLAQIQKTCKGTPAKRKDNDGIRDHIVGCLKMMQTRKETFERIWNRFPSKVGKKEAERHFRASVHTEDDLRDIHKALDNYLGMLQKNPTRPVQNGSTWFNNWRDWINLEEPVYGKGTERGKREAAGSAAGKAATETAGTGAGGFAGGFQDKSDLWT